MAAELREFTLEAFSDYLESNFEAEQFFRTAGLEPSEKFRGRTITIGELREWTRSHFDSLDLRLRADLRKVLTLFENIMFDLEIGDYHEEVRAPQKLQKFVRLLERDGFLYKHGIITDTSRPAESEHLGRKATEMSLSQLELQVQRMLDSIESDPSLAIGTAKEMLETVAKSILDDLGISQNKNWTLNQLLTEAREHLKIRPENIPKDSKGIEAINRLLGNLAAITANMAELRNDYGTGHGRTGKAKGLQSRHARLAAGASSVLCIFLLETYQEQGSQQSPK